MLRVCKLYNDDPNTRESSHVHVHKQQQQQQQENENKKKNKKKKKKKSKKKNKKKKKRKKKKVIGTDEITFSRTLRLAFPTKSTSTTS